MSGFRVHARRVAGPATHAIVIGVSHYPHLNGGGKRLTTAHEGMAQLTSPSVSAREFATWLIKELDDPSKPLATVSLLLSERRRKPFRNPKTNRQVAVEQATMANASKAIAEWKAAGDRNADDRLVFYFCGHGMALGTNASLLFADFGADLNDPLLGALDLMKFRSGMDACDARQQLYLIDACRTGSDRLVAQENRFGQPVVAPDPFASRPPTPCQQPIFYSTLAGERAFGRARKPSFFTDALLRAMQGAGADDPNDDGTWRVETTQLLRAIDVYMQRAIENGVPRANMPATVELSRFDLHFLSKPPVVPIVVRCRPPEDTPLARLSFNATGQGKRKSRAPAPRQWELDLPIGRYDFRAELAGQPPRMRTSTARPVELRVELDAGP